MTNNRTPTPADIEISPLHGLSAAPQHAYDNRAVMPGDTPRLNPLVSLYYDITNYAMVKGVKDSFLIAQKRAYEAALQGTIVAPALDAWGAYEQLQGVTEPTGRTFGLLRGFAEQCEPVAAIHNTRIEQIAAFCRPADSRWGKSMTAGCRVRMTKRGDKASVADRDEIEKLQQFILEAGFCPPPAEERPIGWQPGLEPFIRALMRDQLTLDWVAVRTWPSAVDPKAFPIVAFAAVDAGLIRNKRRVVESFDDDGINVFRPQETARKNIKQKTQITHVRVDGDGGGRTLEEFTDDELFTAFMRPRTDVGSNGYGYSVLEQAIQAITIWISARDMNALRFSKDTAPRGILTILGNMNPQQFQKFVQDWKLMMQGVKNRHTLPIIQGSPVAGSSVQYSPLDPNPRDMEYSQFTFAVATWMHALYCISTSETGWDVTNPTKPPLSEASPESQLKYSQDTGLTPLLRWLENLINRHIVWRMYPDRRYTFEWVGLGDYNEMDDVNMRMASMQACLTTPLMNWNEMDITGEIDPQWVNHPAAKMPGLFSQNLQMLMTMQQSQQAEQQQSDQQDAQQQQDAQGQQDAEEQQGKDDAASQQDRDDAQNDREHGQNMDKFNAGLEQQKLLMQQQGQAPNPGDDDEAQNTSVKNTKNSVDKTSNIVDNKVDKNTKSGGKNAQEASKPDGGAESAPGFLKPGSRFGGGASTRPMAKKPIGKGVDGDGQSIGQIVVRK
jgi:hypothetical protein